MNFTEPDLTDLDMIVMVWECFELNHVATGLPLVLKIHNAWLGCAEQSSQAGRQVVVIGRYGMCTVYVCTQYRVTTIQCDSGIWD